MQTMEKIAAGIKAISEELKRPMSNLERTLLVADRKELREKMASMAAPTSSAASITTNNALR